jgi:hypothetical protein
MRIVLQYCKKTVLYWDQTLEGEQWTPEKADQLGWTTWSKTWVIPYEYGNYQGHSMEAFAGAVRSYGTTNSNYIFRVVEVDEDKNTVDPVRVLVEPFCPRDNYDMFRQFSIPDPNVPSVPEFVAGEEEEEGLLYQPKRHAPYTPPLAV